MQNVAQTKRTCAFGCFCLLFDSFGGTVLQRNESPSARSCGCREEFHPRKEGCWRREAKHSVSLILCYIICECFIIQYLFLFWKFLECAMDLHNVNTIVSFLSAMIIPSSSCKLFFKHIFWQIFKLKYIYGIKWIYLNTNKLEILCWLFSLDVQPKLPMKSIDTNSMMLWWMDFLLIGWKVLIRFCSFDTQKYLFWHEFINQVSY